MPRKGEAMSEEQKMKIRETKRSRWNERHLQKKETMKKQLTSLLTTEGPMPLYEATKKLGLSPYNRRRWLMDVLSTYPAIFGYAKFSLGSSGGGRGYYKFTSYQLFNGLSVMHSGPIIWLKGDERMIPFIGSRIMKAKKPNEARSIRSHLNRLFGKKMARKMVEYGGYKYSQDWKG